MLKEPYPYMWLSQIIHYFPTFNVNFKLIIQACNYLEVCEWYESIVCDIHMIPSITSSSWLYLIGTIKPYKLEAELKQISYMELRINTFYNSEIK